jgi:hypothetical protein
MTFVDFALEQSESAMVLTEAAAIRDGSYLVYNPDEGVESVDDFEARRQHSRTSQDLTEENEAITLDAPAIQIEAERDEVARKATV